MDMPQPPRDEKAEARFLNRLDQVGEIYWRVIRASQARHDAYMHMAGYREEEGTLVTSCGFPAEEYLEDEEGGSPAKCRCQYIAAASEEADRLMRATQIYFEIAEL